MPSKPLSKRNPQKRAGLQKGRASRSLTTSTSTWFSKDLTNVLNAISGTAQNALHSFVPLIGESAIPFPVASPPSPEKPSGKQILNGAPSARVPIVKRRRFLKDALTKRDTAVVGSTLNFESLSTLELGGTMLTPKILLSSLEDNDVFYHAWVAVKSIVDSRDCESDVKLADLATERFLIELGKQCIDLVPGPHLTFIDPRLHNDSAAIARQARRMISRFEDGGVDRSRVVFTIPATQEGILAAKELEAASIQTNLILVSSLIHAAACVEAGVTTTTIDVDSVFKWFDKVAHAPTDSATDGPAIETIQTILEYFRIHKVTTKLVGTNFSTLPEVTSLGYGFDAISLSDTQINEWLKTQRPLSPPPAASSPPSLRARQAQYPTSLLSSKKGFLSAMSAETRKMVVASLYVNLGKMRSHMDKLVAAIDEELDRQLAMASIDMGVLYRHWRMQMKSCCLLTTELGAGLAEEPKFDWFLDGIGREIRDLFELEDQESATVITMSPSPNEVDSEDEAASQQHDDLGNQPLKEGIDFF